MTKKKKIKNRWKLPILIGGVILGIIVMLTVVIVTLQFQNKQDGKSSIFPSLTTAIVNVNLQFPAGVNQQDQHAPNRNGQSGIQPCHLTGDYIFNFRNLGLINGNGGWFKPSWTFLKNWNVPAGKYEVALEAFDGYQNRRSTRGQNHEQYRVLFKKDNSTVASTGYTSDIQDRVDNARVTNVVNQSMTISDFNKIVIEHYAVAKGNTGSADSVRAVCMSLKLIPQPINGQCGSAALVRMLYDSAPTENLCTKGTPTEITESSDSAGRVWSWKCKGSNNGQDSPVCKAHGRALPICGDGSVNQESENCDNGSEDNGKVCVPTYGQDCSYCDANCQNKTVTAPKCGDGSIESAHEQCDDGADKNGVVPTVGYGETKTYCKSDCTNGSVTGGQCGNGTREGDEQCDDGSDKNGQVCVPAYGKSCTYCDNNCQNKTVSGADCGDGTINGDEQCDDGDDNGKIPTVDYGHTKTYCKSDCTKGSVTGGQCGNGTKEGDEECDDGNNRNGDGCSSACQTEKEPKKEKKESCDSSIGNYIWYDTNGNGVQEDIEEGISGIKVCAYKGDKKYCDTTDKHGRYKIKNLCAGKYEVKVKGVDQMTQTYDPDSKKDNKTKVKLKDNDKHTKADFGYRGKAPSTGFATNVALLIGISTLITIGILLFMRKKGQI